MRKRHLFAGLDVSTQGTKLLAIDADTGRICHLDAIDYDRDLPAYGTCEGAVRGLGEGVSESDPNMWLAAVEMLLERLAEGDVDPAEILCVSVSGQMHGLVALDAEGRLARPRAKLWNDFSTREECRLLTDAIGGVEAMIAEIGNTQRAGYTAPKILHMKRHEPQAFDRTATFLVVHNFINWYLTGGIDGGIRCLEPGDASGTALWDPARRTWSAPLLRAIDPDLGSRLPPVNPVDATIGTVGRRLARRFGLSPDCRIDAGCGDNMYGALGTGNWQPGSITVSLGTSGTAATIVPDPWIDARGEIACYCDSTGNYMPLLCVSNMANGYNAARERYRLTHEQFDAMLSATEPGNGGRVLLPWYEGERTPDLPQAAALTFGFALEDFTPERLCRAVLEGHVLNLYHGYARLPVQATEIRLTGGLARSPSWRQTIADVFEADVVPVRGEGAALGAAIHAAWIWFREHGSGPDLDALIDTFVHLDEARRTRPRSATAATYRAQRELFAALSARVRGLSSEDPFALRGRLIR